MSKLSPSFYPELGDKCHQQAAGMFPVMCVTDLQNKILISNFPTAESPWVITKGRVTITTYWDASTAYFQCTVPSLDMTEDIPPAPGNLFRHRAKKDDITSLRVDEINKVKEDLQGVPEQNDGRYTGQDTLESYIVSNEFTASDLKEKVEAFFKDNGVSAKLNTLYILRDDIITSLEASSDIGKMRVDKSDENADQKFKVPDGKAEDVKKVLQGVFDKFKTEPPAGTTSTDETAQATATTTTITDPNDLGNNNGYLTTAYYLDANDQGTYNYEEEAAGPEIAKLPLATLDEICIFLGYLPEMRPVTPQDLKDSRLLRRGVWVIDTITRSGGASTGVIMTIQCRDRLKYLMDTFGSYNTAESDDILVEDLKNYKTNSPTAGEDTVKNRVVNKRSDVILKIARRGIGQSNQFSVGGRRINAGWIYDPIVQGRADAGEIIGDLLNSPPGNNAYEDEDGNIYEKINNNKYRVKKAGSNNWEIYERVIDGDGISYRRIYTTGSSEVDGTALSGTGTQQKIENINDPQRFKDIEDAYAAAAERNVKPGAEETTEPPVSNETPSNETPSNETTSNETTSNETTSNETTSNETTSNETPDYSKIPPKVGVVRDRGSDTEFLQYGSDGSFTFYSLENGELKKGVSYKSDHPLYESTLVRYNNAVANGYSVNSEEILGNTQSSQRVNQVNNGYRVYKEGSTTQYADYVRVREDGYIRYYAIYSNGSRRRVTRPTYLRAEKLFNSK